MKLQNLTVIFTIIILPVILITSLYISTGLRTIEYQSRYDTGLIDATYDAIFAFEQNIANIKLAGNPEIKRSILKSSIKMFEKSLCNTCNISAYNAGDIEQYIPAIVFGMYDGFYMYSPSYNPKNNKYEHGLKNYVYYSETLKGIGNGGSDIVIRYSLDNYVSVFGDFKNDSEEYIVKQGYLIDTNNSSSDGKKYKDIVIGTEDIDGDGTLENDDAINYYINAYDFTIWFNKNVGDYVKDSNDHYFLQINKNNDPENENSTFAQHKRKVIKNKIEGVLNSSITAYSERNFKRTYKMPKLSVEDWEKIYSNISMITFFQGKNIGVTQYNGYCVLNSTNNREYVNPNLMYFIDGTDDINHYYHDIRCEKIKNTTQQLTGYKIGVFKKRKEEKKDDEGNYETDANGNTVYTYIYDHEALACYNCVNGPLTTNKTVYNYILNEASDKIKIAYWTSLARERYKQVHL